MRQMKDSGFEWIGNIPNEWEVGQIGQLYSERKEKVSDNDYMPLSVTMKGILPQLSTAAKTDAHDDRKLVLKGDFAINSRSDRRGSCGISDYDGSVSLINTIMKPRTEMNPQYYEWLFHSTMFSDEFYRWGHGIVNDLWTTNWSDMKKIVVPIPPLKEQERIAEFITFQCTHIDNIIEKTKESIEEYKKLKQAIITQAVTKGVRGDRPMKDSGVEWIGEIPNEWSMLKSLYTIESLGDVDHFMPDSVDIGKPYLMIGDLKEHTSEIDFEKCKQISNEDFDNLAEKYKPQKGDVIIARYATIGTACYVNTDNDFLVSYACVTLRPNENNMTGKYMFYFIKTYAFVEEIRRFINSNTQGNVGKDSLTRFHMVVPSIVEQTEIVSYLDGKCAEMDILISKKEQFIIELENYKKSMIYEYVTGKKEVPSS